MFFSMDRGLHHAFPTAQSSWRRWEWWPLLESTNVFLSASWSLWERNCLHTLSRACYVTLMWFHVTGGVSHYLPAKFHTLRTANSTLEFLMNWLLNVNALAYSYDTLTKAVCRRYCSQQHCLLYIYYNCSRDYCCTSIMRGHRKPQPSVCPRSIKFSLPSLYLWRHSRDLIDQALYPKVLRVEVQRSLIVCAKVESLGTRLPVGSTTRCSTITLSF